MYSKISNWLLIQDEKFFSTIKDERQRIDHLARLYRYRTTCVFLLFLFAVISIVVAVIEAQGSAFPLALLLFIAQLLNYLDTDSKIRAIRLYELLSGPDEKSN